MTFFKNKIALVTGGSSGIGAATAKLLEHKGARVFCAQRTRSLHEDILVDLKDNNNPKKIISEIKPNEAEKLIYDETIKEGMIPKIRTCINSVENGVRGVVIIDGRKPHSILFELFSDEGFGTLIRK